MKVLDIALKDLTRSVRSLFALGMMIGAPLVITGLIYFAFGGGGGGPTDLPAVKVGVVNGDTLPANSPLSAPLGAPLGDAIHDMFHDSSVQRWLTATDYADEAAARAAVDGQQIGVAVIIPARFTESFLAGQSDAPILIVQDPTLSLGPLVVREMVSSLLDGVSGAGIALTTLRDRERALGLTLPPAQIPAIIQQYQAWYTDFQRALFHTPDTAALKTTAPAAAASPAPSANPMQQILGLIMAGQMIFFAFYTGAYSMLSVLREEEEGTLARLFTAPLSHTTILAGKFLAVFLTVILQGLFLMAFARLAFGLDWGQPLSVALVTVGQVMAAAGLGVLLIALMKNSRQAGPVLGGALTALGMLGGLFTASVPNMPAAFAMLANFTPHGWVMQGWKLALAGQPPSALLLPFAVTAAMGLVMFAAGAALFQRRFA
jgi:ABC-2 type transport system permease protein